MHLTHIEIATYFLILNGVSAGHVLYKLIDLGTPNMHVAVQVKHKKARQLSEQYARIWKLFEKKAQQAIDNGSWEQHFMSKEDLTFIQDMKAVQ